MLLAPEVVLRPRDAPTAIAYTESDVWSLGITAIEMAEAGDESLTPLGRAMLDRTRRDVAEASAAGAPS